MNMKKWDGIRREGKTEDRKLSHSNGVIFTSYLLGSAWMHVGDAISFASLSHTTFIATF